MLNAIGAPVVKPFITPERTTTESSSINILSLIIIGGMGSIPGVFIGGLALVGLPLLLSQFADFRYLIYGAALVAMMLIKPEGLAPEARRRLELHEAEKEMAFDEPEPVLNTPGQ